MLKENQMYSAPLLDHRRFHILFNIFRAITLALAVGLVASLFIVGEVQYKIRKPTLLLVPQDNEKTAHLNPISSETSADHLSSTTNIQSATSRIIEKPLINFAASHLFTTADLIGKAASEELKSNPHRKRSPDVAFSGVQLSPDIVAALDSADAVIADATKGLIGFDEPYEHASHSMKNPLLPLPNNRHVSPPHPHLPRTSMDMSASEMKVPNFEHITWSPVEKKTRF